MTLTPDQYQTLANALRAETDQSVIDAVAIRGDNFLTQWCNTPTTTKAWSCQEINTVNLFEVMKMPKFLLLNAVQRDAWRLMLENQPLDFGKNQYRNAIVDIWGNTDSIEILEAVLFFATKGHLYLGGTSKTTNTVTGLDLSCSGALFQISDISTALNQY